MAIKYYDSLNVTGTTDSYFFGDVGIGNTSPSQKLHVTGNVRVTGAYYDSSNLAGTSGQVLSSTVTGTSWIDQSTITANNAEHVVIYAKNTHTASIAKGTPVYITGTVGATDTVEIAPADASNSAKMPAVGLLDDTLAVNAFGYVITGGFMDNITTDPIDGATPSSNDTVYVKAGGGLTLTKPTGASNLIQNVAKVGKVSGGNSGSLIVSSILRTNDVPNLSTGKIWVGSAANTIESATVHLDETNVRMGIGITSPSSKLDVNGTVNLTNLTVSSSQGTDGQVLTSTGSGVAWEDVSGGSSPWVADTNGITYTAGNVGIGTASQATLDLAVNGAARFSSDVRLDESLLDVNGATGTSGQILSSEGAGGGVEWIDAGVKSSTSGEPSGSDSVINIVSLTQAEYDAGTPVATTLYIIT